MSDDEIQLNDPQALYRNWEGSQWNPFEVDLRTDREQWAAMAESDRELVHWVLSSLMVAEERITTKFSGLVGAYGTEEEATYLATQQVDEARHMQFYARFQDEVVDSPATVAAHELLPSVAESLSPGSDGEGPDVGALGVGPDEIRDFALGGLTRRLDIIGVPVATL